ncbi:MAG: hypothetical protein AABZ12_02570 [Planctomycetota bacterium]
MFTGKRWAWLTTGATLAVVGIVVAQDPARDAQNKLLARRAAEADCYRKLAETVYGVKINSETHVRDFITESDEIRAGVDTFIRGVRLGQPRYYEDGACEVEAEVTVAKLISTLKEVHTAHYKGNTVKTTDFEQIKESIKTDVIKVTGSGAPRPDLPPNLPQGVEQAITPLPPEYKPPAVMPVPGIWKSVPPNERLMAERAGEVDAMRKLLEQIKGLRLTSDTLVRDFITESDEISTQAQGIVIGARRVGKYLHEDELIAEVTMEVPVEQVVTKIKELHSEHYHGNKVTTTDIQNIKQTVDRQYIQATGSGVPRRQIISQVQSSGVEMPQWMDRTIEATGEGTDPGMDTAQGKLKAARAAALDGMRKLTEQVYGLEIRSGTVVRDFVTQHDEITTQVEAIIDGAVTAPAIFEQGTARVTVTLPAADVWRVVHQHMVIVQRRG